MMTLKYLVLLIIFTPAPLHGRFKWKIGAIVRSGGMITLLALDGLTDSLFTLHHKWR